MFLFCFVFFFFFLFFLLFFFVVFFFTHVRGDITECFTNISEKVRDAVFSDDLPKYGF